MSDTLLVLDGQKEPRLFALLKPLMIEEPGEFGWLMCSLVSSDCPHYLHVNLLIDGKQSEFLIPHSAVALIAHGVPDRTLGFHRAAPPDGQTQ